MDQYSIIDTLVYVLHVRVRNPRTARKDPQVEELDRLIDNVIPTKGDADGKIAWKAATIDLTQYNVTRREVCLAAMATLQVKVDRPQGYCLTIEDLAAAVIKEMALVDQVTDEVNRNSEISLDVVIALKTKYAIWYYFTGKEIKQYDSRGCYYYGKYYHRYHTLWTQTTAQKCDVDDHGKWKTCLESKYENVLWAKGIYWRFNVKGYEHVSCDLCRYRQNDDQRHLDMYSDLKQHIIDILPGLMFSEQETGSPDGEGVSHASKYWQEDSAAADSEAAVSGSGDHSAETDESSSGGSCEDSGDDSSLFLDDVAYESEETERWMRRVDCSSHSHSRSNNSKPGLLAGMYSWATASRASDSVEVEVSPVWPGASFEGCSSNCASGV